VEVFPFNPVPQHDYFARFLLQEGYRVSSLKIEKIWIFLYEFNRLLVMQKFWELVVNQVVGRNLRKFLKKNRITKIVVLHFLLITPALWAGRATGQRLPIVTVVTDPFTAHNFWQRQKQIPKIVFSQRAKNEAVRLYGALEENIHVFPVILKKDFNHILTEEERRKKREELGFSQDKRLILFAGGGEGYPRGEIYIGALLNSPLDIEIAVVCGHDELQKWTIQTMAKLHKTKKVIAFGFVDFMFELMNIADIVVSKGGPATILEALILKKPLIVTQYIYGQEKGNVEFLIRNGVGFYTTGVRDMVETVSLLNTKPAFSIEIQKRLNALQIDIGTDGILDFILSYPAGRSSASGTAP
jgi:processive 1,2-diacylglycerol beta-glucosyltransferase/1,2-diacylglycerol 3-beta-galactosyltransferase